MPIARTRVSWAVGAVRRRSRRASARRGRVRPAGARPPATPGTGPGIASEVPPRTAGHSAADPAIVTVDDLRPARLHLVRDAAARLAAGERPSSHAIAEMAIRRVACDLPI
jgi:hypothetical protein